MDNNILKAQYDFIKLLACLQASLEIFDEIEGTPYYKQGLKNSVNNTKRAVEKTLEVTFRFLDNDEKEETYRSIDRAVNNILESTVEDLFLSGYQPINNQDGD